METTQNTRTIIAIIAAIALLGAAAYLFWNRTGVIPASTATTTPSTVSTSSQQAATTTVSLPGGAAVSGTGNFTVTQVPDKTKPDLKTLIDLGASRKHAGNYAGAATAWEQASALYPANVVSFNNLGDLYMNFLHNYPKAELNYLKQIVNIPSDINAYSTLFTLYTELYKKGTSAAEDILKKGIAANPKAVSLQASLAAYYRDSGRTAEAKAEYQAAIDNAKSQGLTSLATQLESERAAF